MKFGYAKNNNSVVINSKQILDFLNGSKTSIPGVNACSRRTAISVMTLINGIENHIKEPAQNRLTVKIKIANQPVTIQIAPRPLSYHDKKLPKEMHFKIYQAAAKNIMEHMLSKGRDVVKDPSDIQKINDILEGENSLYNARLESRDFF